MRKFVDRRRFGHVQGFTVTELAIVVGLTTLFLACAFYAMTPATRNVKVNQGSDELNTVIANARAFYAGQNTSLANLNAINAANGGPAITKDPQFCYYTPLMTAGTAGIFPNNMLQQVNGNGAQVANHLWSTATNCGGNAGSAEVSLVCTQVGGQCTDPVQIVVAFTNMPEPDICASILMQNANVGAELGLTQIIVNTQTLTTIPPSSVQIQTLCGAAGNNYTIEWYYGITQ